MSVPVGDRKESKFEAITFSVELHNMLIELMQRDFGIKDVDDFVRVQFAHGRIDKEDFSHYQYLMHQFKTEINRTALMLTSNVRAANSIYPSSQLPKEIAISEWEKRRQYQDYAILNCETLINHLQRVIDVFKVDINKFERHVKAIDRERGISFSRNRFEAHLQKYFRKYGTDGYILFGDFTKFYDNIIHEIAKAELLKLLDDDEFMGWLLGIIFDGFKVDVSYMSDEEFENCLYDTFNKLDYRMIAKELLTGEKFMEKSVNIGDQISQVIGIYYPYPIDNYVKYVRGEKFYGRYMDDWYIMNPSKEELLDILDNIIRIAGELGIHINEKKTRIVKISSTFKYLQIEYTLTDTGKIIKHLNPKRVVDMRRRLKKLAAKVGAGEIDYDSVENMFRSWMGSFYKLLSEQKRENLISLYEELFPKKIEIVRTGCKTKMLFHDLAA